MTSGCRALTTFQKLAVAAAKTSTVPVRRNLAACGKPDNAASAFCAEQVPPFCPWYCQDWRHRCCHCLSRGLVLAEIATSSSQYYYSARRPLACVAKTSQPRLLCLLQDNLALSKRCRHIAKSVQQFEPAQAANAGRIATKCLICPMADLNGQQVSLCTLVIPCPFTQQSWSARGPRVGWQS